MTSNAPATPPQGALSLGTLTLPAHLALAAPAARFAEHVAGLLDLGTAEAGLLRLAVEEAFVNAVRHFSGPTEGETVHLEFQIQDNALVVSVRDRGIPFAPGQGRPCTPKALGDLDAPGLGSLLMRGAVDSVEFLVHGRRGKETRLTKALGPGTLPDGLAPVRRSRRGRDRSTVQRMEVRVPTRDELAEVSRLAWRCYGYSQEALLYDPDALREKVDAGALLPVVAVDEDSGGMIGHMALKIHDPAVPVGELGLAFVDPAFRCPLATKKMSEILVAMARQAGHRGMFDCSVTTHTISQRCMQEYVGSRPCGLMLAIAASGMHARELATSTQDKGSVVNHYIAFDRSPARVHVPERHRAMAEAIYSWLDLPREFAAPAPGPATGPSGLHVFPMPEELNAVILMVQAVGRDTAREVAGALAQCRRERRDAAYLFLPLADPACPALAEACEALGFFFAGVMPHIHDGGDRLLLQFVDIPLDLESIRVLGPQGRQLFDYVTAEMARAQGASAAR